MACINPRLNPLIPEVPGTAEEDFIRLRNAGNISPGPVSGTMRSLALACASQGGREIVILGRSECWVRQMTVLQRTDRFRALGVAHSTAENLNEFFGLFASERQNMIRACDFARASPLIGTAMPVHGLPVDVESGRLE